METIVPGHLHKPVDEYNKVSTRIFILDYTLIIIAPHIIPWLSFLIIELTGCLICFILKGVMEILILIPITRELARPVRWQYEEVYEFLCYFGHAFKGVYTRRYSLAFLTTVGLHSSFLPGSWRLLALPICAYYYFPPLTKAFTLVCENLAGEIRLRKAMLGWVEIWWLLYLTAMQGWYFGETVDILDQGYAWIEKRGDCLLCL